MIKQFRSLATGVALALAAAAASAAPWVDVYNPGDIKLSSGEQTSWVHNITDNGFMPGVDTVTGFTLSMYLYDDSNYDSAEYARYIIPGYDSGSFEVNSGNYGGSFSIGASYVLNALGQLSVTLRATGGDFYFDRSTLTANGTDGNRVPEPGSLALVGLALTGLALRRRARTQA